MMQAVLLLAGLVCSAPQFPATYEQYAVTISKYRWNFNLPQLLDPVFRFTVFGGLEVYANPFRTIKLAELPRYNVPFIDANVVVCDHQRVTCGKGATPFLFDWRLANASEPTQGVLWQTAGEPRKMSQADEYDDWAFEFSFQCSDNPDLDGGTLSFDPTASSPSFQLIFRSQVFCPEVIEVAPSPTPGYTPFCLAFFPDTNNEGRALFANVYSLNEGRLGYSSLLADRSKFVIFQPCERSLVCPLWDDRLCDWSGNADNQSSAWVCDVVGDAWPPTKCTSYGLLDGDFSGFQGGYSLITAGNVDDGFKWNLKSQGGKSTNVEMRCADEYPRGHLQFLAGQTTVTGNTLNIKTTSSEACPHLGQPPENLDDQCKVFDQVGDWTFDFQLGKFDQQVWTATVRNTDLPFDNNFTLFYKPCAPDTCPYGYDCQGYGGNGNVWLCETMQFPGQSMKLCEPYGLNVEGLFNIGIWPTEGYHWRAGVDVRYQASNTRGAEVHYWCNDDLSDDELQMPTTVRLTDGTLSFTVRAKGVCPTGSGPTPPPPPRYIPSRPSSLQTPPPMWSPNPGRAIFNDTHFIVFSLLHVQEPFPMRLWQTANVSHHLTNMYTEWFSWDFIPCPADHVCPTREANLWECFRDIDWIPYCLPVADKRVWGLSVAPMVPDNWDVGVRVLYPGPLGAEMQLVARCERTMAYAKDVPIANSLIHYWTDGQGIQHFLFETHSNYVCPRAYSTVTVPTLKRQVVPEVAPQNFAVDGVWGRQHVRLDLTKMRTIQNTIIIGWDENYHQGQIFITPAGVSACPKDKSCGAYATDLASIWECVGRNNSNCFPIGDVRYGMNLHFVNTQEPIWGVTANYLGGAQGYNAHLYFVCNQTSQFGQFFIDHNGFEDEARSVMMMIHTREVCPTDEFGQINWGSWFILVLAVIALIYFGLGTLLTFGLAGTVSLPNEEFWSELLGYFITGITFVFTCGGKVGGGTSVLSTAALSSTYTSI